MTNSTAIMWKRASPGSIACALTFANTHRRLIAECYDALDRIVPSPIHAPTRRRRSLPARPASRARPPGTRRCPENVPARYPGWHAVIGEFHFRLGQYSAAERRSAGGAAIDSSRHREFLRGRIADCPGSLGLAADPNS